MVWGFGDLGVDGLGVGGLEVGVLGVGCLGGGVGDLFIPHQLHFWHMKASFQSLALVPVHLVCTQPPWWHHMQD